MRSFFSLFAATALLVGISGAHTSAWEEIPIKVVACDTSSCTEIPNWNIVPLRTWAKICPMKGYTFICNISGDTEANSLYSNITRMQELDAVITELEAKFDKNGKLNPIDQDALDDAWVEWMDRAYQEFPEAQNFRITDKFASNKPSRRTSVLLAHH